MIGAASTPMWTSNFDSYSFCPRDKASDRHFNTHSDPLEYRLLPREHPLFLADTVFDPFLVLPLYSRPVLLLQTRASANLSLIQLGDYLLEPTDDAGLSRPPFSQLVFLRPPPLVPDLCV